MPTFARKSQNMEVTCHNCGKNISEDTPKCVFCGADRATIHHFTINEPEVNQVIVPEGLSLEAVEGRVSIKHKIRLQKTPLPEIVPPVIAEKPIISPQIAEIVPPVIAEKEVILPKVEEKQAPIIVEKQPILPQVEEKPTPIIIEKEPILPVIATEIEEKTVIEPLNIPQILADAKEKDKQVETFLEKNMPLPQPIVEKELYSVSDALKEILAEEQKLLDFLEEKPVEKELVFPKKEIEKPIEKALIFPPKVEEKPVILEENTSLFTPKTQVESPDTPILGIEKMVQKVANKQGKPAIAWLIRHTENRKPVYYEVFEGDNTLGRGDNATPIEIDISDDKYVSRGHAWIRASRVPGNVHIFELRDDGAKRKDKSPSMNGTYLNASMRRIDPHITMYLQDGDTIQVGMTKLVFKVKSPAAANQQAVFSEVLQSDYTITVIF